MALIASAPSFGFGNLSLRTIASPTTDSRARLPERAAWRWRAQGLATSAFRSDWSISTDHRIPWPVKGVVVIPAPTLPATPAWPPTLPQNQFIDLTDVRQDARARTEMDAGPAKMRRRFSAAVRLVKTPIIITGAQRKTWDVFYITTLEEGSLRFTWTDPVTDSALYFRIEKPPMWTLKTGHADQDQRIWQAMLELEVLP